MTTKKIIPMADNSRIVTVVVKVDGEVMGATQMPYFTAIGYTAQMERIAPQGVTYHIER